MPASKEITVVKTGTDSFTVKFPIAVKGPGGHKSGDEVPVEWLRGALDYYIQHREPNGALNTAAQAKVKALW
ncbi:MAG: hypothetical protein ABJC09_00350 [Terriglobia bacterium]